MDLFNVGILSQRRRTPLETSPPPWKPQNLHLDSSFSGIRMYLRETEWWHVDCSIELIRPHRHRDNFNFAFSLWSLWTSRTLEFGWTVFRVTVSALHRLQTLPPSTATASIPTDIFRRICNALLVNISINTATSFSPSLPFLPSFDPYCYGVVIVSLWSPYAICRMSAMREKFM